MATADAPQESRAQTRNVLALVATTLVVVAAVAGGWILDLRDSDVISYDSVRAMALKVGCENTLSPATRPGGALSAGRCTLADGTVVDLRVYAGAGEGVAWLDGTGTGPAAGRSIGVTGGPWVALVHSTDLTVGNSVVGPLTTP